jgi:hypothetical protein
LFKSGRSGRPVVQVWPVRKAGLQVRPVRKAGFSDQAGEEGQLFRSDRSERPVSSSQDYKRPKVDEHISKIEKLHREPVKFWFL